MSSDESDSSTPSPSPSEPPTPTPITPSPIDGPAASIVISGISLDSGVLINDFITNDNDGLTISGTLTEALATGEILEYSNDGGVTFSDVTSSVTGTSISLDDAALTSTNTIQFRVTDAEGVSGAVVSRIVTIDTDAPEFDPMNVVSDLDENSGANQLIYSCLLYTSPSPRDS